MNQTLSNPFLENMTTQFSEEMSATQIQSLFEEAKMHYRSRRLKKALNLVHIVLDFSEKETEDLAVFDEAKLLIARIYLTKGKYQDDATYYGKAMVFLKDLEEEINEVNPIKNVEMYLLFGEIYQHLKEYSQANNYFNRSLVLSKKTNLLKGSIEALIGLSQQAVLEKNYERAFELVQKAWDLFSNSNKSKNAYLKIVVLQQLAEVHIWRKEYSKALELSQKLVKAAKKTGNIEREVAGLKNIALVSGVKSNYKVGMQYFLDALKKSEKIGYRKQNAQIFVNIGTIYAHLYNYKEATKHYQEVLNNYDDFLDDKNRIIIYNNLGNIHFTTDKQKAARGYFEKAFQLALDSNFREMLVHTLAQLSRTDLKLGNTKKAIQSAKKAQELIEELGNINGQQINLLNLAKVEAINDNLHKAVLLTEKGIEAAKTMKDDTTEIEGYKMLAKYFKALGNFEKALDYQIIFSKIQEKFAKVQHSRQFLDLEIRHAIQKKQREIKQLTKENELQGLLLEKSDQIARQNHELLQANEELRQFAYVASHDLKEPLRMIGSYTQIIERLIGDQLDNRQKSYFSFVTDGVERMNALLDALLKFATVGKSNDELEKLDLNIIAELSLQNLKVRIEENEAKISSTELPQVKGRKTLLIQLFQNLIGNAIKFQRPEITPEIQISTEKTDTEYIIHIKDNGIGIPERSKDRIFEIFQRLHQRSAYEGTGIGLAICMKIIQRLGGRLWVESTEGMGSTFSFSLPK